MPQDVWAIHGGNAFDRYEDYLTDLRAKTGLTRERLRLPDWKGTLEKDLGPEFEVFLPHFPNKQNAKYLEWKIFFEKLIPLMRTPVILIGHSLGGIFLAKYLAEERVHLPVLATLLVAAPYNTPTIHPLADFVLPPSLDLFDKQAGRLLLYHSTDDQIVPYSNVQDYHQALPRAELRPFSDRGHFIGSSFPELVQDIGTISPPNPRLP